MGVVLPLKRLQPQDWTATERAWLAALVDHLRHADGGFQLEYGRSDVGEPWCVVTDPGDEVVLHAARISGQVVVHHAPEDVLAEEDDLREALRRVFGPEWLTVSPATVTPFSAGGAAVQAVLALAVMGWLDAKLDLFRLEPNDRGEVAAPVAATASPVETTEGDRATALDAGSDAPEAASTAHARATPDHHPVVDVPEHRAAPADAPVLRVADAAEPSGGEVGVTLVGPTPDGRAAGVAENEIVLARGGRAEATLGTDVFVLPADLGAGGREPVDLGVVSGFDFAADRFETADHVVLALHASDTPDRFWLDVDGDGAADAWVTLQARDWGVIGPVPTDADPKG